MKEVIEKVGEERLVIVNIKMALNYFQMKNCLSGWHSCNTLASY